jgi:hypothetical protein
MDMSRIVIGNVIGWCWSAVQPKGSGTMILQETLNLNLLAYLEFVH